MCTTWSLSAWMASSCSFCLLCSCSFSSATFWNHTHKPTGRKIQCIFSMTVMDAAVSLWSINLCRCASAPESDPEALTAVFRPLPRVCKCLSSYSLSGHPSIALWYVQQMGFNIRGIWQGGPERISPGWRSLNLSAISAHEGLWIWAPPLSSVGSHQF